ncbi:hypothetical protein [Streptomyces prunicolor]
MTPQSPDEESRFTVDGLFWGTVLTVLTWLSVCGFIATVLVL